MTPEKEKLGLNADQTNPGDPADAGKFSEILYRESVSGTVHPDPQGHPAPETAGFRWIGASSEEEVERLQKLGWRLSPEEALCGKSKPAKERGIETWSVELKSYKEDYDSLKASYKDLVANNAKTDANWKTRTQEMETEFSEQIKKNDTDLTNLKESYDSYMSLAAPRNYWAKKSVEHGRRIKELRTYLIVFALIGIVILGVAAFCLLPEFYPKDSIPWRNLALFLLISTFVIWLLKLIVKLLLSNIHLYSDAKERVVMIQTFMALVRSKKDGDGLEKADLALVLAPIFKPSTTGVIKDDGGPITLTDFISRLGEK